MLSGMLGPTGLPALCPVALGARELGSALARLNKVQVTPVLTSLGPTKRRRSAMTSCVQVRWEKDRKKMLYLIVHNYLHR